MAELPFFVTRPGVATFALEPHFFGQNEAETTQAIAANVPCEVVQVIHSRAASGLTYNERNLTLGNIPLKSDANSDTIDLSTEHIERLAGAFRQLEPGHAIGSIALVAAVQDWNEFPDNKNNLNIRRSSLNSHNSDIKSGVPYNIITQVKGNWQRTYAGIGTNNGKLLSTLGQGLPLATLRPQDAINVYGLDPEVTFIHEAVSPVFAPCFFRGVVPDHIRQL